LGQARWLEWYAQHFNTVEVDSTFYGTPPRSRVAHWEELAPRGFEFSLKAPQIITHEKSLANCGEDVSQFLRSAAALREKLGPILFQFPHSFGPERLGDLLRFLDELPRPEFRYVVEVRNRDWVKTELARELQAREVPLCWVDHPWMPRYTPLTGRFIYARFLGDRDALTVFKQRQLDRTGDLKWWAEELVGWLRQDVPVYGYFNNEYSGHAPTDAKEFGEILQAQL
jgi:uncharacterized protein YecE (DUF72 family)